MILESLERLAGILLLSGALLGTARASAPEPVRPNVLFVFIDDMGYGDLGCTGNRDQSPNLAIRDGRWKLLVNDDGSRLELYDFETSTSEEDDVGRAHPEVARRLSEMLLAWRKSLPELERSGPPPAGDGRT